MLHSIVSVTNCAGVKICLNVSAEKIAALYTRTVEAAKKVILIHVGEARKPAKYLDRNRDSSDLSLCTPSTEDNPLLS